MSNVLLILLTFTLLPFVVFFCVKLGTYAFYRGKQLFHDEFGEKDER